jgi:hypothetical protein
MSEISSAGFPKAAGLLGLVGLLVLFAALRWNSYDAPLIRDEGEYAYAARLLLHRHVPYEQCFVQKPPMIIYSYALAELLAPRVFWFPRVLAGLCVTVSTGLLGYIAHKEFGPGVAIPAMWLVTPMVLLPGLEQFTANTEMFMLLPMMGVVTLYVYARHSNNGGGWIWFAAGSLSAIALCYKYTVFPLLAGLFAFWSWEEFQTRRNLASLGKHWLFALSGLVLGLAATLGFFLIHDGGKSLWEWTVAFNRFYLASGAFGLASFLNRLHLFWNAWWILFLLPVSLIIWRERRVWFWIGLFLVAGLTTAASVYGHYYITIMPFWALLGAVALRRLVRLIPFSATGQARTIPLLVCLVVVLLCLTDIPWLTRTKKDFVAGKLRTPFLESEAVAKRVAELTTPEDYVFVAGSEPQILYYSQRFSATRFVTVYPLMIPSPMAQRYQWDAIHDLQEHPPTIIVLVQLSASWLRRVNSPSDFLNYLGRILQVEYELLGGYVIEEQSGQWTEPLSSSDIDHASLLLFKRRQF